MSSEKLHQSGYMYGKYNVAFHEFAHQIHWLFTPEQNQKLKQLYIRAKKGGNTLDWYADLNEREYFAQGVEADLSEHKLTRLSASLNNTRGDLLKKDPALFDFIESLAKQKTYKENIVQAYILKSRNLDSIPDRISCLKNALLLFPDHPGLLIELGNDYSWNSDYEKAIQTHRYVVMKYPDNQTAKAESAGNRDQKTNQIKIAMNFKKCVLAMPLLMFALLANAQMKQDSLKIIEAVNPNVEILIINAGWEDPVWAREFLLKVSIARRKGVQAMIEN